MNNEENIQDYEDNDSHHSYNISKYRNYPFQFHKD